MPERHSTLEEKFWKRCTRNEIQGIELQERQDRDTVELPEEGAHRAAAKRDASQDS